ncbi:F420-dependent oxidoreductase [Mycobacteroides sp. H001]|uniref:LLM class F420-dependent oxidoreductase n=1 Tax=unclassified Mycobacteroides TaxID=2618759 RepID=UPI00071279CD|nr:MULTISPECIES: LLM class F420-dependent oxidoreductase [unclassified Mycobacteroides]KRQ20399.1 F420-dependent oxidoreductase [Mycobacteroides sp. H072]KRQ34256.1 F420-dependent oxidoreductase [Mycobacteroides sp. H002]KRQ52027.1 F420-dependent oxidoreductase [Mycobacteroides sp. H054]KRQ71299.1 F420-dependent oxidoreductase [Mycobacteroides sp. H001]
MTTAATLAKPHLGRFGVWLDDRTIAPELAAGIEGLGYGAVWIGGSPGADLAWAEPALVATTTLVAASGVVTIWTAPPSTLAQTYHRIDGAHPGRFLLGVGIGHPEHAGDYRAPYDALVGYLDDLDAAGVPAARRMLAALGPRMLRLSGERSAGAHPFLTTPEHTAAARERLGASALLAPEHKVVLSADADHARARAVGRQVLDKYLGLSNMVSSLRRQGFTDVDVCGPGSDRLVDALVAHGSAEVVSARLREHLDAGADHVAIQVLGARTQADILPALTDLAAALDLAPVQT